MKIKDSLIKLGLKKQEAAIYLTCLELGISTATPIAKKAGIKRTYFYDLVENLINQGFIIQTVKGKKKHFSAVEPERLLEIQKEKLKLAEIILPQLKSIHNISGKKPKVRFYEGKEGLDEAYNDTLKYKGEILAFTTEKFLSADEKKLSTDYIKKRKNLKIPLKVIGPMSKELLEIKNKDKSELRETKLLPREIFTSDIEIGIYGNKVNFINLNKEFGLIIESKEIADVMKRLFQIIWKGGFVIE